MVHFKRKNGFWVARAIGHYGCPPRKGWDGEMGKENLPFQIRMVLFLLEKKEKAFY